VSRYRGRVDNGLTPPLDPAKSRRNVPVGKRWTPSPPTFEPAPEPPRWNGEDTEEAPERALERRAVALLACRECRGPGPLNSYRLCQCCQ
jgi:hypothetical protein